MRGWRPEAGRAKARGMQARLYPQKKSSTQSGKARVGTWILEFEQLRPRRADPLMGWSGGANTDTQVKMTFPTREAAEAYAAREGLVVEVVPDTPHKLIIQSYADNFR